MVVSFECQSSCVGCRRNASLCGCHRHGLDRQGRDPLAASAQPTAALGAGNACLLVPLAAFALVTLRPCRPGRDRAAGAGGVGRCAAVAAQTAAHRRRAYIFSLVLVSSLLAIFVVPAWLSLLGPQFGKPLELAPTQVALILAKSFLLPLAAGVLLRWWLPAFAERWSSRLIGAAGLVPRCAHWRCWAALGGAARRPLGRRVGLDGSGGDGTWPSAMRSAADARRPHRTRPWPARRGTSALRCWLPHRCPGRAPR